MSELDEAFRTVEELRLAGWFFQLADVIELPEWVARLQDVSAMAETIPEAIRKAVEKARGVMRAIEGETTTF